MLPIAVDYGRMYGGIIPGAVAMARGLMQDDPATFKRGYSFDSALLTVTEAFELDESTRKCVRDTLGDQMAAADA